MQTIASIDELTQVKLGQIIKINYKEKIIDAICMDINLDKTPVWGLGLGMIKKYCGLSNTTISHLIVDNEIIFPSGLKFKFKRLTCLNKNTYLVIPIEELENLLLAFLDESKKLRAKTKQNIQKFLYNKTIFTQETLSRKINERKIACRISFKLNGQIEYKTPIGRIDILTQDKVIEVKNVKDWKQASGQVIAYQHYFPNHEKELYFFGKIPSLKMQEKITEICNNSLVKVNFDFCK